MTKRDSVFNACNSLNLVADDITIIEVIFIEKGAGHLVTIG